MFTFTIKLTDIPNIQDKLKHITHFITKKSQLVTFASGNRKQRILSD